MNAKPWNGDYDHDHESVADPDCPDCGAGAHEPCLFTCQCPYCARQAKRREDARELLAEMREAREL